MFNTASPTQFEFNAPGMAFPLRSDNTVKRKSSYNIHDELESGLSVDMQKTDSHDAKRRRGPSGNIPCLQCPMSLSCQLNSLNYTTLQHVHQPQELLSQQIPHPSVQFSHSPLNNNPSGQQIQLNTPPLESPSGFQLSCHSITGDEDIDDDMMIDDECTTGMPRSAIPTPSTNAHYHSHTAPPSPVTPSLLGADGYDDDSNPIKWEGIKHKGYPRGAYEDPNASLWNSEGRILRKNMDGQVKGFKMGYVEGCEKCRVRARGHFGHFIMADSI